MTTADTREVLEANVRRIDLPDEDQLPAGPARDLTVALHDLYSGAGRPSLRNIAKATSEGGFDDLASSETVSQMLNGKSIPRWSKFDCVVRQLAIWNSPRLNQEDEVARFKRLWRAAIGDAPRVEVTSEPSSGSSTVITGPGARAGAGPIARDHERVGHDRPMAFTERWRRTTDGSETDTLMTLGNIGFSHSSVVSPPPWQDKYASIRIAGLVACDPLSPETPTTSELRSRFLKFLDRPPIMELVGPLTNAGGLTWKSYGGNGRMNLQAILAGDDQEATPAAAALLNLPTAGASLHGHDPRYAEFVLYMEPPTPNGKPVPAVNLAAWHKRFIWALAVPTALAEFLARDTGLATNDDPPAQAGLWLVAAHPMMTELVDTEALKPVPGSTLSNAFTGYMLADPAGKPAAAAALDLLTQMCDLTLHLNDYEPVLEALAVTESRASASRRPRTTLDRFAEVGWMEPFWGMPRSEWPDALLEPPGPPWPPKPREARVDRAVGIYLGETNSVIAVVEGGEPEVISNAEGSRTTPSVVYFAKNGEMRVGEFAERKAVTNTDRTIRLAKRHMGTDWSVVIDGQNFTMQQISAFILGKLKRDAEENLGEILTDAVITVPAYFNKVQRQATKEAAQIAGLDVLGFIKEPIAAALAYHLEKEEEATILVFDLGGCTLNVSLLEVCDYAMWVKATSGNDHLGGDDWDQRIVDWLVHDFKNTYGTDLSNDKLALGRLRDSAEEARIELSGAAETQINLPYISHSEQRRLHLDTQITRVEFQRMTSDLLDRCKAPICRLVEEARRGLGDIDHVVLAGGSTQMPAVVDLVRELTGGNEPSKSINPDKVVAVGASLRARALKST